MLQARSREIVDLGVNGMSASAHTRAGSVDSRSHWDRDVRRGGGPPRHQRNVEIRICLGGRRDALVAGQVFRRKYRRPVGRFPGFPSGAGRPTETNLPLHTPRADRLVWPIGPQGCSATVVAFFSNRTPEVEPTLECTELQPVWSAPNAVDPDSERLTFTVTTQPAHGTAAVSAGRLWTYTPSPMVAATGVADSFFGDCQRRRQRFAIHGLSG